LITITQAPQTSAYISTGSGFFKTIYTDAK